MRREPLATVEDTVTTAGGLGCVRLGRGGPSWGANPSLWLRDDEVPLEDTARLLADDINAAVEAREAPLLALLAEARMVLLEFEQTLRRNGIWPAGVTGDGLALAQRIDALAPGEWVPKAKLDDALRVIGDLQQELGKPVGSPLPAKPDAG